MRTSTPPRPRLLVSRCLTPDRCRYDGGDAPSELVRRLAEHADLVAVCPETEIGLGVPRDPIRIVIAEGEMRLVQPSTGRDLTKLMTGFRSTFLDGLGEVDGAILKSRSPSCGLRDTSVLSDRDGAVLLTNQAGMFGQEVLRRFVGTPVEDDARLQDDRTAGHFLTAAFTLASFRQLDGSMRELIEFQSRNKLLLMLYSQKEMRALGGIVADRSGGGAPEAYRRYRERLGAALRQLPSRNSPVNVMMHAFGYVSAQLDGEERRSFLDALQAYREERMSLDRCLELTRSLIARTGNEYLEAQTFFRPYPKACGKTVPLMGSEIMHRRAR